MKKTWTAISIFLFSSILPVVAQLNLPIRNIGGKEYYYRQIKKKETIYGISKELGISKNDIIKYNPSVGSGLKKDQIIYFPVSAFSKSENQDFERPSSHTHIVKGGETLYGISKIYNTSVENLLKNNPNARDGQKKGMALTIPLQGTSVANNSGFPYVVKSGDTLYRLAVNFNVDLKQLLAENPGVTPDNFKAGMTIFIPAATKSTDIAQVDDVFILEEANRGETLESMAEEYNVPEEQLREANPDIDKLKRGTYVTIPKLQKDSIVDEEVKVQAAYEELQGVMEKSTVNIAILLPFEATLSSPGKQALLYRDFYRGVLVALDEIRQQDETDIHLSVYDIDGYNIDRILDKDDIKGADLIFAPGEEELLGRIAGFGQANGINVVNAFSVNNDMYYENDRFIQINTPSSYMYASIQSFVMKEFPEYQIVFLKDSDISEDKPLIKYMEMLDMPTRSIDLATASDFKVESKTLFIPTASGRETLRKVQEFIGNLKDEEVASEYALLGYPEWVIHSEYAEFFKKTDTYLFSRYVVEADKDLDKRYSYWFGEKPINSYPKMYALGYDLGKYFVQTVALDGKNFADSMQPLVGTQISMNPMRSSNWGGFVNTSVFIYHYNKSGIEKIPVK